MANFPGLVLTAAGRNLQAKAQIGTKLTFTRVALGDGSSTDWEAMTSLANEMQSLAIQEFEATDDGLSRMRVIMTNEGVTNGFFVRELGVFARDPDTGEEALYSYTNAGGQPDFLPAGGGATLVENVFDLYTVVGNAQNVTAVINDYITIATKQDIDVIRPMLLPDEGTTHQMLRKRSNADGDTEWFDPLEGVSIQLQSIEERRIAVDGQRTFALGIVTTQGLAVYVNGERYGRSRWQALGATQMRFTVALNDGDEVLFVKNEETGEFEEARISLTGEGLIFPGTSNDYTITDYDAFAEYEVSASQGTVTRAGPVITVELAPEQADGAMDINIARDGRGATYAIAIGAPRVQRPQVTYPGGGDTGIDLQPTFSATGFATYPENFDAQASSTWVVARDAELTDIVKEFTSATALSSWRPDEPLPLNEDLFVSVVYTGDSLGDSEPAPAVAFRTTDQYIMQPTITSPVDGATDIPEQPILETSAFATFPAGVDTHRASSWWLYDDQNNVAWQSLNNTSNLTSIAIPAGVIEEGKTYRPEAQHHGDSLPDSARSEPVSFTTSNSFIPENDASGTAFGGGYFAQRMVDEVGAPYALVVASKADGEASGTMTWQDAVNYCEGLTIGGRNDWRLPTVDECRALYWELKPTTYSNDTSYGASSLIDPPTSNYTSDNPSQTAITAFREGGAEAFIANLYWSATVSGSGAYRVGFYNGTEGLVSKTSSGYVRAVRREYF